MLKLEVSGLMLQDGTQMIVREGEQAAKHLMRAQGGRGRSSRGGGTSKARAPQDDETTIFMCGFCEQMFSTPLQINKHIQEHAHEAGGGDASVSASASAFDTTNDIETISLSVKGDLDETTLPDGTQIIHQA